MGKGEGEGGSSGDMVGRVHVQNDGLDPPMTVQFLFRYSQYVRSGYIAVSDRNVGIYAICVGCNL